MVRLTATILRYLIYCLVWLPIVIFDWLDQFTHPTESDGPSGQWNEQKASGPKDSPNIRY